MPCSDEKWHARLFSLTWIALTLWVEVEGLSGGIEFGIGAT